ncbi:MAG: polysaccharide deacetylase family protein [Saprospiraceae bacterium]
MYLVKTPSIIQKCFPKFLWRKQTEEKMLYLTFDDGPIPEVTPWVLDQLEKHNAKATFFCVGDNVAKHPEIYQEILKRNHTVGNHTHNHLNGWTTKTKKYLENITTCTRHVDSKLFRPPYGRLRPSQSKQLWKDYTVVMWDVLSGDFDTNISGSQCWENVQKNTEPGSIIVFHDSLKAKKRLYEVLPKTLEYFGERDYTFKALRDR